MERVRQPSVTGEKETAAEPSSFEEFFRAEHVRLFRALYLVTGSVQEAEDLMQESFVRVWERWDRVAGMERPVGYLYRTAMNAFRSRTRRAMRAARRPFARASGTDQLGAVEERDEVVRVLRTLSPRQRQALVLTEYVGYSSEEAATVMGVKAATVRALAHQGRQAIQGTPDE